MCKFIKSIFLKVTQEPIFQHWNDNFTWLYLMYESDSTDVQREEEAYSFLSLVADCGGVLGLFIGFNFLMVWEWIVWAGSKLSLRF